MVIPLAMMSGMMLLEVFYSASRSTQLLQDQMLVAHAFGISEYAIRSEGDLLLLDNIQQMSADTVFYRVQGPENAYTTGYAGVPGLPEGVVPDYQTPYFYDAVYRGESVRVVALRTLVELPQFGGWMTVYVAQPTGIRDEAVWGQVTGSTIRLGLLIAIAGGLAWVGVTQGLKPLTRLEQDIGRRSFEDLSPIEVAVPREVTNVVNALNGLLERLHNSIQRNTAFLSNASHQLRTPVAGLVAQTELALREQNDDSACARAVESIHQTSLRMSRLIAQLLSLARVGGSTATHHEFAPIDMLALGRRVTADAVPAAITRNIDLGFDGATQDAMVFGNETLLEEMLRNLIDNACQYCPQGSEVTVLIGRMDEFVLVDVIDNGPGIPNDERDKALERFARLDERHGGGSGLGLPIAVEVTQVHGGRLTLQTPNRGTGLQVHIELPVFSTGGRAEIQSASQ